MSTLRTREFTRGRTRGRTRRRHGVRAAVLACVGPLLVGLVAIVFAAGPAAAHAEVESTDPGEGTVLATSPDRLTLTFTESVRLGAEGNQLLDAAGQPAPADFRVRDRSLVVTPDQPLDDGSWVLAWRVTSADGHPISGGLQFSVGAPSSGPVVTAAPEQRREVNLARVLGASARYVGFATGVGLACFAVWLVVPRRRGALSDPRTQPGPDSTLGRVQAAALGLGVLGHLTLVPATAVWQDGGSWSALGQSQTWTQSLDAWSWGVTVALAGAGLLAVLGTRRRSPVAAGGALLALLTAFAAEGHTRSMTPTWLVVGADAAHVAAGAIWLGSLVGLVVLLRAPGLRERELAATVQRVSTAAAASLLGVVLAGVLLAWRIAPELSTLWSTDWGRLVLAKVVLVAGPVAALAWWNRCRLVPQVMAARDAREARQRLLTSVRWEAGVLVTVLALTGVLVAQSPLTAAAPRAVQTLQPAAPETLHLPLGEGRHAMLTVGPMRRGANTVHLSLADGSGRPLTLHGELSLSATQREAGVGPIAVALQPGEAGRWTGSATLPVAGRWTMSLSVPLGEFENPVVSAEVWVP